MYSWEQTDLRGTVYASTHLPIILVVFLAMWLWWWIFLASLSLTAIPSRVQLFFYFLANESCPLSYKMWTGYKSLFALNMVTVYPWPPFVAVFIFLKHKTTRNDIIRERRNPLVPIMCPLGAWYFLFRGQLLSLLFTPHDHSWRVQLCLESLPRSGTEESDC